MGRKILDFKTPLWARGGGISHKSKNEIERNEMGKIFILFGIC